MRVHKLNNKKKKGFTLVEVIIALGIIGIIAIFIFPAITSLLNISSKNKENAKKIFALEEAIEVSKEKDTSTFTYKSNGYDVNVLISPYKNSKNLKVIEASLDGRKLKLVIKNEK